LADFAGADPSGKACSDRALTTALQKNDYVIIPPYAAFRIGDGSAFKVTGDNKTIECVGTGKLLTSGGHVMLDVYGQNFTAKNLNATGYLSAICAVQLRAPGKIIGGKFDGDWIYPLAFASDGCSGSGWSIDGTRAPHMNAAVLAQSCNGLVLTDFVIDAYQGFGIHYVNQDRTRAASTGWKIVNGQIHGRRETLVVTAKEGQSVFEFRTQRRCVRFGVQVNSTPIEAKSYQLSDISGGSRQFRLTISPRKAGDRVALYANASLEAVNIGSRVAEGLISNVTSEEAGDSGFVVCDDDHRGSGWQIAFEGCVAKSPLFAGFAETSTDTRQNTYTNCTVQNAGMALNSGPDVIYSSGFMLSGSNGRVKGCKVINDLVHPTAKYGVFLNGSGASWDVSPQQFVGSFVNQIRR
jgi:hypothetical protein